MENTKTNPKRRHGAEFKSQVLRQCEQPGVSVAAIALAHGLNANLVRKWRSKANAQSCQSAVATNAPTQGQQCEFVAINLSPPGPAQFSAPASAGLSDIRLQLHRGAVAMTIHWPVAAATECGTWLREVLR